MFVMSDAECHVYDARRCVLIQQTITVDTPDLSPLRCTKVCSHTTDNHSWHTWLVTSTMHEGVFSYNRQITADTPELSPLRCTKVCFSYNRQSQLTHLTCHLYDARMCVLIQQTITVDTPDLSPLRCTKVCFHTTDNHSWYTWLVTSMMHERVFSYNRQITADTPDLSRLWCTRCALIQQTITADTPDLSPLWCTNVCSHTTDKSQLTHLTCHVYDARGVLSYNR